MSLYPPIKPQAPTTVPVGPGQTTLAQWLMGVKPALVQVKNADATQVLTCQLWRRADTSMDFSPAATPTDLLAVEPGQTGSHSIEPDGSHEVLVTGQASGAGLDAVVAVKEYSR